MPARRCSSAAIAVSRRSRSSLWSVVFMAGTLDLFGRVVVVAFCVLNEQACEPLEQEVRLDPYGFHQGGCVVQISPPRMAMPGETVAGA